ncbi:ATP-binding protein [Streptomyces sp. NPDC002755]|uniref:ATP-binding protein n=1 Tax=Streptomyces sp. NPDC002884 TaxID=3154544 RepID=UPI00331B0634
MKNVGKFDWIKSATDAAHSTQADLSKYPAPQKIARNLVRSALMYEDEQWVDSITLIADELVGNALQHAQTASGIHFSLNILRWCAIVAVKDGGSEFTKPICQPVGAPPEVESGRGLLIVDTISDYWGIQATESGKRVFALLLRNSTG